MKNYLRLTLCLLSALVLLLTCACTQQETIDPPTQTTTPVVDMRDEENYEAILSYIQAHPDETVIYDVTLGSKDYDPETDVALSYTAEETPYEDLLNNLKYLPNITKLDLPDTGLTGQQMAALKEANPHVEITYTVSMNGQPLDLNTTEMDLSGMTADQIPIVATKISLLPQLQQVQLMAADGTSQLSKADVKALQQACPDVLFLYSFELFGKTISTADERVEYDSVYIGDEGEAQIREALDILTSCTYFKADSCGISSPVMAGIRDDYPNTKVVWRVHCSIFNMLTDEKVLRLTHKVKDEHVGELKYCTEAVYIDMGHDDYLTDIDFLRYMPDLECIILSGSSISDISAFENCKKLVWVELAFCSQIKDISVFKDHPTLKYLNISYTGVRDISPIQDVALERFNCMNNRIGADAQNTFTSAHPDCIALFAGKQPYGYGWRYNDNGYTFFEYYANMRKYFRYGEPGYVGNQKGKETPATYLIID